jgi:hypothetical protein
MSRIWVRPQEYSFLKVSEIVNRLMVDCFGEQMASRSVNNPQDVKILLAHYAVYGGICENDLIYLRCVYEDCCLDGVIAGAI